MGGDFSQKNVDCSKGIYALTGNLKLVQPLKPYTLTKFNIRIFFKLVMCLNWSVANSKVNWTYFVHFSKYIVEK